MASVQLFLYIKFKSFIEMANFHQLKTVQNKSFKNNIQHLFDCSQFKNIINLSYTHFQFIFTYDKYILAQHTMPIRPITRMGNPVLRKIAQKVKPEDIPSKEIQDIIKDLQDTMISAKGLGIAAPQIGISLHICIIQVPQYNPRYGKLTPFPKSVVINPIITPLTNQTQGFWQGCLSIPGIRGYVERPRKIKVQYYDQFGNAKDLVIQGFGAVVFQHETDHLNGTLFIDKVSDKKIAFIQEFDQFKLSESQNILDD